MSSRTSSRSSTAPAIRTATPPPPIPPRIYRAFPDTRIEEHVGGTPEWTEHNGAGYGHIVFYADATTKLFAGYRWGVNSSTAHPVAERPIAAARVCPR
jgi:hypothetical protein